MAKADDVLKKITITEADDFFKAVSDIDKITDAIATFQMKDWVHPNHKSFKAIVGDDKALKKEIADVGAKVKAAGAALDNLADSLEVADRDRG